MAKWTNDIIVIIKTKHLELIHEIDNIIYLEPDMKRIKFVIDMNSIRGSDDEQIRIGIRNLIIKDKEEGLMVQSKQQEITYGIIKTILSSSEGLIDLILYFQTENRGYNDMQNLINSYFSEYNINTENNNSKINKNTIRILIGNQSLFYYLGWMSSQIMKVFWITKEKSLFSKNFYWTMSSILREIPIKICNPNNSLSAL